MGNTVNNRQLKSNKKYKYNIFYYNCNILYVDDKFCNTEYIDFIELKDIGNNNVMKGVDSIHRQFIVIKAEYVYNNKKTIQTFSTFFQRFINENLWHCCGHHGRLIMDTCGGMNNIQFKLLYDLLYNKEVTLTKELIKSARLNIPLTDYEYKIYGIEETNYPILLRLGYSS